MLPDRVSNPGPPTYESGALPIALRGPAYDHEKMYVNIRLAFANAHSQVNVFAVWYSYNLLLIRNGADFINNTHMLMLHQA